MAASSSDLDTVVPLPLVTGSSNHRVTLRSPLQQVAAFTQPSNQICNALAKQHEAGKKKWCCKTSLSITQEPKKKSTTAKKSSLQPLGSQSNTKHFYVDRSILHAVPLMQQFLCDLQPQVAQHQSTKRQPQQVSTNCNASC